MIHAISGIRSYVTAVPTVTQQQRVNQVQLERNEVTDNLRNGKTDQTTAMAQSTNLDSKLTDAKAPQVKSAEEIKTVQQTDSNKDVATTSPIQNVVVDRQQKGKELSPVEKQQLVDQQMKQVAINNQVLHGLV